MQKNTKALATTWVSLFMLVTNLFGQVRNFEDIPDDILKHLPKMGMECSRLLNRYESDYFNVIFKDSRKNFNFTDKKLGFIRGSQAGGLSNKQVYFSGEKQRFADKASVTINQLYVFNKEEKELSGGYDAVIVSWSKVSVRREDLVEKLKMANPQ